MHEGLFKIADDVINTSKETAYKISMEIYKNPELGYKEYKTSQIISEALEKIGYKVNKNVAVTGAIASIDFKKPGPRIALLSELDAIICLDHGDSNIETGAAHVCGHHIQVGIGYLVAKALKMLENEDLYGGVDFLFVPAEEYIDMEYRFKLRESGNIKYFGGKQEMIRKGCFDNIDIAISTHNFPPENMNGKKLLIGGESLGFISKKVEFIGKTAHAATGPENGVNALTALMLGINNINSIRDIFPDEDKVRVHYIINESGDVVNTVPSYASLEMHVRNRATKGLIDVNRRINNCLQAGALAVGCKVKINEIPGYLPNVNYQNINYLCKDIAKNFLKDDEIDYGKLSGAANDFGDVSHLMTTLKLSVGGIEGALHSDSFRLVDYEEACVLPAKIITKLIIKLLEKEALKAKTILAENVQKLTKDEYLNYQDSVSRVLEYCFNNRSN